MSETDLTPSYPLAWPPGWPRTEEWRRTIGPFKMPPGKTRYELKRELEMLGATGITINSNVMTRADGLPYAKQPRVDDPGVVLYFRLEDNEVCIPCDRWSSIDANLRAIGMAVEAIRGMERWGTGQMVKAAFSGFTAIPANASAGLRPRRPWHEVLGVSADAPREVVEAAGKAMQRKTHPDAGGSDTAFKEVQDAIEETQR
jgi:hypothetical protein